MYDDERVLGWTVRKSVALLCAAIVLSVSGPAYARPTALVAKHGGAVLGGLGCQRVLPDDLPTSAPLPAKRAPGRGASIAPHPTPAPEPVRVARRSPHPSWIVKRDEIMRRCSVETPRGYHSPVRAHSSGSTARDARS
jgi:hypothetical protein